MNQIQCPKCHHTFAYDHQFLLGPQHIQQIMDGTIFQLSCPNCHHQAMVEEDHLYLDDNKKQMILYGNVETCAMYEAMYNENTTTLGQKMHEYTTRLVSTFSDFQQKVYLFYMDHDDRIIELYKRLCVEQLQQDDVELIFQQEELLVMKDGQQIGTIAHQQDLLDGLKNIHISKQPLWVDALWASQQLAGK